MKVELITVSEAAAFLGVSKASLNKWRSTKEQAIPYVKIGERVKYNMMDLLSYIEKHTIRE